jgi:predicted DNA-binding ribbon-helix-helix protein
MRDRILKRAAEGREAIKTLETPFWEGLAVVAFMAVMPVAVLLS